MGGRVLALNEGRGQRPLLVVRVVKFIPQRDAFRPCTVLSGDQVMVPSENGGLGSALPPTAQFINFLQPQIGIPTSWSQMRSRPLPDFDQFVRRWPLLPLGVIKQGTMTLLAAGNDPIHGYWMQFDGKIPIFDQQQWWEEPDDDFEFIEDPEIGEF